MAARTREHDVHQVHGVHESIDLEQTAAHVVQQPLVQHAHTFHLGWGEG